MHPITGLAHLLSLFLTMIYRLAVAPVARVALGLFFQALSRGHRPFLCGPLWPLDLRLVVLQRVDGADQGLQARSHRSPPS
jgi:hypothetical protein